LRAHRSGSAEFVFDQAPATILDRQRTARAETHRICHDHARTGLGDTAIGAGAGRAEHPEAAQRLMQANLERQLAEERARASEALRDREAMLQIALKANGMALWVWI